MGNIFNPDAPLMQGLSKVADMLLLNLITVILSIPVVTAGAAMTALYDTTWRSIQDEGGIYRSYFRSFKSNFKQATVLWLIVAVAGVLLTFSLIFYVSNNMMVITVIVAVLLLIWAVTAAWIFPLQSRFENRIAVTLKNALFCGLGYLPRSIVMVVLNLLPWVLFLFATSLWIQMSFLWIALWFAMTAYVNMMVIRKPFRKLIGEDPVPVEANEEE